MTNQLMMISSDGHATARMEDYREYLDSDLLEEFDAFLAVYRPYAEQHWGRPMFTSTQMRLDPEEFDPWIHRNADTGRLDGNSDPSRRLQELESEGVVA